MKPYVLLEHLECRRLYAATMNDADYAKQTDLAAANVQAAWAKTTGSLNVVVADIDTGLDYDHPDLYANVWINQAEIPGWYRKHLKDVDGDGRISFYDLDSHTNARWMTDVNGDGVIDPGDLLTSTKKGGWDDAYDADKNGYTDDIIGWDFADNDNDPLDYIGHGSHTAGTIAAQQDNGKGIAGIATTSLMVVKIFGDGDDAATATEDRIAAAIRYSADEGAKISNNSWGYTLDSVGGSSVSGAGVGRYTLTYDAENSATPTYYYPPYGRYGYPWDGGDTRGGGSTTTDVIEDAIAYAGTKGQLFVAAAGNDGNDNDFSYLGNYPASYTDANILSVAATANDGTLSYFSNYGENSVDLAAPGEDVYSTWLNNGYQTESGTSMATPHVTGTLALMLAAYPKLSATDAKADLLAGVDTNGSVYSALVSGGTLDAGAAVHAALVARSKAAGTYSAVAASKKATAKGLALFSETAITSGGADPKSVLT